MTQSIRPGSQPGSQRGRQPGRPGSQPGSQPAPEPLAAVDARLHPDAIGALEARPPGQLIEAILAELGGSLRELRCGMMERIIHLGVSMTQIHVLWLLEHHGEVPMSRLAELLDVSVSTSTGLIDRMEERGLVERTRVRDDRRIVLVRMGPAGIHVLDEIQAIQHHRLRRALARLEPSRLCGVLESFTDFHSAIEADLGPVTHRHGHVTEPSDTPASPAQPATAS